MTRDCDRFNRGELALLLELLDNASGEDSTLAPEDLPTLRAAQAKLVEQLRLLGD